jgi:hypothetical protein
MLIEFASLHLRKLTVNIKNKAGCPWLTPVIPATQKAEIKEDCGSKPAWASSSQEPISKKKITKKGWWSSSRCRP